MFPYLLILIAFLSDRLSKTWATTYYAEHGPTTFHPLFQLRQTYNRGIALGMFQGIAPLIGWVSLGIVVGLFVYLVRTPWELRLMRAGLALTIGGALGNMLDRLTTGQVLDFIATPLRPGVFNVADVMIYLGLFLTLIAASFSRGSDLLAD